MKKNILYISPNDIFFLILNFVFNITHFLEFVFMIVVITWSIIKNSNSKERYQAMSIQGPISCLHSLHFSLCNFLTLQFFSKMFVAWLHSAEWKVKCAKWLSWTLQVLLHVSQFLKSEKQITLHFAVFIANTLYRWPVKTSSPITIWVKTTYQ